MSGIILAHNAKLKVEVNRLKLLNAAIDTTWTEIHKAIEQGRYEVKVNYGFAIAFETEKIKKHFEHYGYKVYRKCDSGLKFKWD